MQQLSPSWEDVAMEYLRGDIRAMERRQIAEGVIDQLKADLGDIPFDEVAVQADIYSSYDSAMTQQDIQYGASVENGVVTDNSNQPIRMLDQNFDDIVYGNARRGIDAREYPPRPEDPPPAPENIQTSIALSAFCRLVIADYSVVWGGGESRVATSSVLSAVVSGVIG